MRVAKFIIVLLFLLMSSSAFAQNLLPPMALVEPNMTVNLNTAVQLDGTHSYDPNGLPIVAWSWVVVSAPAGAANPLSATNIATPTFTGNVLGQYYLSLTVEDNAQLWSNQAFELITVVQNQPPVALPPVASAGPNMSVNLNTAVQLDGTHSYDPNGFPIVAWSWVVVSAPAGAANPLSATNIATPTFTGTVPGQYSIGLMVEDNAQLWSGQSTVTITVVQNPPPFPVPPLAYAGQNMTDIQGTTIQLTGTAVDPNGLPILAWSWVVVSAPAGAPNPLGAADTPTPTFNSSILGQYYLSLTVFDGQLWSNQAFVTITVVALLPPVAVINATPTSGPAPLTVQFDGTQSYDPQGGALQYAWEFGDGNSATTPIASNTYITPSPAPYEACLVVVDPLDAVGEVCIQIYVLPPLPIANAGSSQTVHAGKVVTLDGSGSSDPSGLVPLTYAWSFVSVPPGSTATLSGPTSVHPTFTADLVGNYVIQLVVTNSTGVQSSPSTVTISTTNTAPIANPGPDQVIIQVGTTVQLDGSHSYDPDGDTITYLWTITTKPQNSLATLASATTATTSFVADVDGTYVITLVVSDPWVPSLPKTVTVSFENVKPVADAGAAQAGVVGTPVTLDGSGSSDANLLPLTYQWSFVLVPTGSQAAITNPSAAQATFDPDQPGIYIVQLIVADSFLTSDPSTVQIKVVSQLTEIHTLLKNLIDYIGSLDRRDFKNCSMRNDLIRMLQDVMTDVEQRHQGDSLNDLNGIVRRVDGCTVSGAPDRDDWIIDCQAQTAVYSQLMSIISEVKELMSE